MGACRIHHRRAPPGFFPRGIGRSGFARFDETGEGAAKGGGGPRLVAVDMRALSHPWSLGCGGSLKVGAGMRSGSRESRDSAIDSADATGAELQHLQLACEDDACSSCTSHQVDTSGDGDASGGVGWGELAVPNANLPP